MFCLARRLTQDRTSYSSMQSNGIEAASFIPVLADTIAANNLSLKLTCCDAMGWPAQRTMTADLLSEGADEYLDVITGHMYGGDATSPIDANGIPTWLTEAADLDSAWCTTWYSNGGLCEGLTWAVKIANGVINAGLSAYLYWEGVEVNQFQASSYLVASDGTEVTPSGRLWAFAMWSRFVRPGGSRLSTTGTVDGLIWGAFKNPDDSVAIVFTNSNGGASDVTVSVPGFSFTSAEAWVTDNDNAVATHDVTSSGTDVSLSIPGSAVVTVKLSA